jgi:hypothetical protein
VYEHREFTNVSSLLKRSLINFVSGLAYGLLQHDMIERFLLHFFAVSAHGYTRGTWTTPESSNLADRDEPTIPYASTGIHAVPIYLKWMLVFEEPETRTLWLGKATPRDCVARRRGDRHKIH